MSLPVLSHEEFDGLREAEGGDTLVPVFFIHKTEAEDIFEDDWESPNTHGMRAIFLNVTEPHMYTSRSGKTLLVLPVTQTITYKLIDSIYPGESPWLYFLRIAIEQDPDEWILLFRDDDGHEIPPFELDDTSTH
jgi:hypothetical protein